MNRDSDRMRESAGGRAIIDYQDRYQQDECRNALRAMLMQPLMTGDHPEFAIVRRHADTLREWFVHHAGWNLHIERECARLYKRPADLTDDTRGLPSFDRRRYVLLCLAAAVLERAEPQITLHLMGERLLILASDPELTKLGFGFTLETIYERRELVAVCRRLLDWGVLAREAGDEDSYIQCAAGDALYNIRRRVLAGIFAAARGPSTWLPEESPHQLENRLAALVAEHVTDSEDGRKTAMRHNLVRRLLDDPVVYFNNLNADSRTYLLHQRGQMARRLCDASGLIAEQRAEGVALIDEDGFLTDISMPGNGTDSHATLLVAEFLAKGLRDNNAVASVGEAEVLEFIRDAVTRYGRYWRKSAHEPSGERELVDTAIGRLAKLGLITRTSDGIWPLPALARFALGDVSAKSQNQQLTLI